MSEKFEAYPLQEKTRAVMKAVREVRTLALYKEKESAGEFEHPLTFSQRDRFGFVEAARAISEDTGYLLTADQYRAIEQGITKNIPLWVVIAFMHVYGVNPQDMFPYIGGAD